MLDTRIFVETCSFPYDLPRKIDRSPDLEIFDLVFSKYYDIKYIYLQRDLGKMVTSALRRNFSQSSYEQYKIARWNRAYIESFVAQNTTRTLQLRYDQLLEDTNAVEGFICEHIGESVTLDKDNLRNPSLKAQSLVEIEEFIKLAEK